MCVYHFDIQRCCCLFERIMKSYPNICACVYVCVNSWFISTFTLHLFNSLLRALWPHKGKKTDLSHPSFLCSSPLTPSNRSSVHMSCYLSHVCQSHFWDTKACCKALWNPCILSSSENQATRWPQWQTCCWSLSLCLLLLSCYCW